MVSGEPKPVLDRFETLVQEDRGLLQPVEPLVEEKSVRSLTGRGAQVDEEDGQKSFPFYSAISSSRHGTRPCESVGRHFPCPTESPFSWTGVPGQTCEHLERRVVPDSGPVPVQGRSSYHPWVVTGACLPRPSTVRPTLVPTRPLHVPVPAWGPEGFPLPLTS